MKRNAGGVTLTAALVVCALVLGHHLWDYYVNAPWTRDGRVTADVVRVAPEVSGPIETVHVTDNQFVRAGDVLFDISAERFQLAVEAAQADLDNTRETMKFRVSRAARNATLEKKGSISQEAAEQADQEAAAARAEYRSAEVALELARLNLERASVRAPVDGYVTNLHLRKGDYAVAGNASVSLLDAESFRVTGYFRETQLARIAAGDPVRIGLMGVREDLSGHVESFGRGIADRNLSNDALGLPAVEPVFSWVRLAQRIPVRIGLDAVPQGVELAAGMTASIEVEETSGGE
ncbi:efflux RND transporter periplasmic adaptor subunit [Pseudodonghicola flavimaris]|uniref:HlyD family secretion protein n=1 Tax=Pseudodonghicola flavimaris TaxID=3050036 RepID=A0ABT7EVU3_9RHOB|nr:HlyD family secretion protein [Pseudodonghicola flavimaris]MDK3016468.1 HlyD family secretion protein [Pseudodonghicola flavimaris]